VKYLLDTHVLDWAQTDASRLSPRVHAILQEAGVGDLAVSDVSISELARYLASGKIRPAVPPETWLEAAVTDITVLPVTPAIALQAALLDWTVAGKPHRDPCDRHIVATAAGYKLPLLTIDDRIHRLVGVRGLKVVW